MHKPPMDKKLGKNFFAKIIIAFLFAVLLSFSARNDSLLNIQPKSLQKGAVASFEDVSSATSSAVVLPTMSPAPTKTPEVSGNLLSGFCLRAPVLLYHHVEPMETASKEGHTNLNVDSEIFDGQLSYLLSAGYQTISAEQLVDALINHKELPSKSVLLTFDDGYEDFYTYIYPLLQKYHLVANIMIPTGLMENKGYLTWAQLKEMVGSGLVFAYNHTWSHASLAALPAEKMKAEVLTAQRQLEDNLGRSSNIFFYPYGATNAQVIEVLRQNGFVAAFSTVHGFNQCDSFIMNLHRIHIGNAPLTSFGL
ncbi:polysaccharide deacetylase family protein [Candidatus Microgenomates bacterium]|nr:polysaccharide deacetylase family protein [Candidatus Microgenomates bacterium]